jgi:hypothetical protein
MADHYSGSRTPIPVAAALKLCPWCGGPLVLEPHYPVMRLVPGTRMLPEDGIPEPLRTIPAWVCKRAPHCKFREPA